MTRRSRIAAGESLEQRLCLSLDLAALGLPEPLATPREVTFEESLGVPGDSPATKLSPSPGAIEPFLALKSAPTDANVWNYLNPQGSISEQAVDEALRSLSTTGSRDELYYVQGDGGTEPNLEILPMTAQSTPLINLDDFRNDARFAGVDGGGFSAVIIDTGIDRDHPFFGPDNNGNGISDRIVYSYDFYDTNDSDASDYNGHGSNVSSIVASSDSNYQGMAPGAGIIHLKVFPDGSGGASSSDIEEALQWVVANAATYNIASVNLSLGGGNYQTYRADSWFDEFAALADLNVIPVAATGNSFYTYASVEGVGSPASDPSVIAVGAVYDANIGGVGYSSGAVANSTGANRITPFTQRHSVLMDILAPGAPITGANQSGGTVTMHGTSQASPHIAGIAVLAQDLAVQELGRRLTVEEFRSLLRSTAVSLVDGDDEDDNVTNTNKSFPRVDVLALGNAIMNLRSGSIQGVVFDDANGDGNKAGDTGLTGWTVFLDDNNDSLRNLGAATFASSDVSKSVNDYEATRSSLTVANIPGTITDINVQLSLTHTYDGDLWAHLISPGGDRVQLFSEVGGSGDNFSGTIFDDEAGTAVTSGGAPFAASYRPEGTLSNFDGENPNGIWILEVGDRYGGDTGQLTAWSITVGYSERASTTSGGGVYSFSGLVPGPYIVRNSVQTGYHATVPATSARSLTIAAAQVETAADFGVQADDTTAPSVSMVSSTASNGTYVAGDVLDITVQFNESVVVTGTPELELETGSLDRKAGYLSGSGSSTLVFRYTVQSGDTSADLDYTSISALALNGGTIKDAAGNSALLALPNPGASGSLANSKSLVVDAIPRVVEFALTAINVTENAGSVEFTFHSDRPAVRQIEVPFVLSGSATSGQDFFFTTASPLVIPVGQASISLLMSIQDDVWQEAAETIILTLGSPTNAVLGANNIFTVTIDPQTEVFSVGSLQITGSRVDVGLNFPIQLSGLNLYDGPDAPVDAADFVLTGETYGAIRGSLYWDAASQTATFIKTGGPLLSDSYSVKLFSRADGWKSSTGQLLDGDGDGLAGGDFVQTISAGATSQRVVSTPDFARGATNSHGQAVNVPLDSSDTGIPIRIDEGADVVAVHLDMVFDPQLLSISGLANTPLPASWTATFTPLAANRVHIEVSGTSSLAAGAHELLRVLANVPAGASYGATNLIRIENLVVYGEGSATPLPSIGDTAIHKVAFVGDTNADGQYTAQDAGYAAGVRVNTINGFDAHDWTDPSIVADVTGNGSIDAQDSSWIARKRLESSLQPEIPDLPAGSIPVTAGLDATIALDTRVIGRPGELVHLPARVTDSATGLWGVDFDVSFDTTRFDVVSGLNAGGMTLAGMFAAEGGWTLDTWADDTTGQLSVSLYRADSSQATNGQIADLAFQVKPNAASGIYPMTISGYADVPPFSFTYVSGSIELPEPTPPKVTGIFVRGAGWNSNYLNMLATNGLGSSAGGYQLRDGSAQIANASLVTWAVIDQISVTFSEAVTVSAGGLRLLNSSNQDVALAANGFSYDSGTHTARWTLAAPLSRNKFLIALDADTIVDGEGTSLDGEWTTSVSTYSTSGNGVAGGDLYFRFNYLPGDVTLNGQTNTSDVGVVRGVGTAIPNSGNFRYDVTGNNLINTSDVGVIRGWGTLTLAGLPEPSIPPPPAGSPLLAASIGSGAGAALLDSRELAPVVAQAVAAWSATGLDPATRAVLEAVRFTVVDLGPGAYLGMSYPGRIELDDDAAGWGWFVDPSPGEHSEFSRPVGENYWQAAPGSPAQDRMDLLTVVLHELGHQLGLAHEDDEHQRGLMASELAAGVRRFPGATGDRDARPGSHSNDARDDLPRVSAPRGTFAPESPVWAALVDDFFQQALASERRTRRLDDRRQPADRPAKSKTSETPASRS